MRSIITRLMNGSILKRLIESAYNELQRPKVYCSIDGDIGEGYKLTPKRKHETDAGADIVCPRTIMVPAKNGVVIKTGLHVEVPEDCAIIITGRSGLNVFHDLITTGVVDEGYSGEIWVKIYNLGDNPYKFNKGDRIAQMLIIPVIYGEFYMVDSIEGGERGESGFGSTGR